MSEKLQVQKNSSAPSQMAPSPQFQERPFTDERYQPTTSTTTILADLPPNIARPSFNLMNMPVFAPTPAANIDDAGIQRQEEEANNQDLASSEKFNAASAPGEGEDENNQDIQLKEESDIPSQIEEEKIENQDVQLKEESNIPSQIEEGKIENQDVQLKEEFDRDSSEEKPQEDIALKSIQTKLTVGKPGDKYEREADSMAAKVMSTPDSAIQRQTDSQTDEQKEEVQTSPLANSISRLVQRQTAENSEEIQMKLGLQRSQNGSSQASPNIESRLSNTKGGGSPLPDEVRSFMEPRFGADFSSVRVHTDSTAVQMNKDLGAQAFAHGSDIYYGAGKSPGKDELTAHELTHTVQQGGALQLKNKEIQLKFKREKEDKEPIQAKTQFNNTLEIQNKPIGLNGSTTPLIQAKTDPGQILEQLKNTAPSRIVGAYDQAQANSVGAWEGQKQQLEKNLPKIPAPTGLPAKQSAAKEAKPMGKSVAANKELSVSGATKDQSVANAKAPKIDIKEAPPPRPVTATKLAGGNVGKDSESGKGDAQLSQSAQNALASVRLDTNQISTKADTPPKVNLTGDADPAQLDSEQRQSSQQVQQAKTTAAKEINQDFGENNIFPEPSQEILKANKELSLAKVTGSKGGKAPEIPGEIAGGLDRSLSPFLKEKISPEQQKYTVGKQKFDKDTAKAKTDADKEISKLNKETTQKQSQEQKLAKAEVKASKQEWQTELNTAEKQYQEKAGKATADQKKKITTEKQKGEETAAKHIAEAEKKAEQEKQKAETEANQKKEEKKKESGGFLGWVKSAATALIDGLKQAINFIYDNLRKAVKFIFEAAKKLALAAIELAQKAIVGLIKAYGEILKGLVKVVFAAFPEIAKKINSKIDKAINVAVKAVNTAADLLKKGVSAVLDFLANTLDSLLKLIQDIYNGIFTVIGTIVRGEFAELLKRLGNLVNAAKAAPPQFETAGYEELLGGNFDKPLSPLELAQAGVSPGGGATGQAGATDELPKPPWSEANIGVDAVENNMELSPELSAELIEKTNGEGEVELASSDDASRSMDAVMSEVTGEKQGEEKEQENPDDGLSPKQRAEIRWQLMKTNISQWWSNNWPKVLVGATAAIGGFIALNVVTGGAITAALPAIMSVVGPLFVGVTIAQIGGHISDYLAKGWEGHIQAGGKSLAKGLAAGAIELASWLTFKAGGAALKGAKAVAKGGMKLAKGAMNLIAKGAKFIIEKGKVLFKGIAGTGIGKSFQRLKQLGKGLLERMRFKKFRIRIVKRRFQIEGHINPWVLLATGEIVEVDDVPKDARFGTEVSTSAGSGKLIAPGDKLPEQLKSTIEGNAAKGKKDLFELFGVQPGKNINMDVPSAPDGKSYITYAFKDSKGNIVYIGKASYKGTPKQALERRLSRGHEHYSPDLKAEVIATQSSKEANAGAEEFFKQGYQQKGANLTNIDEPLDMGRKSRREKSIVKMEKFLDELGSK